MRAARRAGIQPAIAPMSDNTSAARTSVAGSRGGKPYLLEANERVDLGRRFIGCGVSGRLLESNLLPVGIAHRVAEEA